MLCFGRLLCAASNFCCRLCRLLADATVHYGGRGIPDTQGAGIPISYLSKRQSCVSKSTSEAEIVAKDTSLRLCALPLMLLVEEVFGTTRVQIVVDSQSMVHIL